jgi:hypothetical protein
MLSPVEVRPEFVEEGQNPVLPKGIDLGFRRGDEEALLRIRTTYY